MAPVLLLFLLVLPTVDSVGELSPAVAVPEEEAEAAAELDVGPAVAVDSRGSCAALAWAAVTLKASGVTTSRYAHAGIDVPEGMLEGQTLT